MVLCRHASSLRNHEPSTRPLDWQVAHDQWRKAALENDDQKTSWEASGALGKPWNFGSLLSYLSECTWPMGQPLGWPEALPESLPLSRGRPRTAAFPVLGLAWTCWLCWKVGLGWNRIEPYSTCHICIWCYIVYMLHVCYMAYYIVSCVYHCVPTHNNTYIHNVYCYLCLFSVALWQEIVLELHMLQWVATRWGMVSSGGRVSRWWCGCCGGSTGVKTIRY